MNRALPPLEAAREAATSAGRGGRGAALPLGIPAKAIGVAPPVPAAAMRHPQRNPSVAKAIGHEDASAPLDPGPQRNPSVAKPIGVAPPVPGPTTGAGARACARGFTLLELLIAMAIFSVVATLAHGGLQAVLRAHERTEAVVADLDELRRAWLLFDQDMAALAARGIRDGSGVPRPPFLLTADRVEFTRLRPGDDLPQRIEYRIIDRRLMRFEWPVGNLAPAAEPRSGVVLEEVEFADLSAWTDAGWATAWPVVGQDAASGSVPRALALRLVWRGHALRWMFSVSA